MIIWPGSSFLPERHVAMILDSPIYKCNSDQLDSKIAFDRPTSMVNVLDRFVTDGIHKCEADKKVNSY